ncbi:MAG: hypothetical protein H6Q90_890 [Deltaproteobacteria bacterium]|nr:hypothetical protein [Deltaproteobacteria bacterium]
MLPERRPAGSRGPRERVMRVSRRFGSAAQDFPVSGNNLRGLDTGLRIARGASSDTTCRFIEPGAQPDATDMCPPEVTPRRPSMRRALVGLLAVSLAGCTLYRSSSHADPPDGPPDGGGGSSDGGGGGGDAPLAARCTLVPQSGCAADQACDLGNGTTEATACREITDVRTSDDECSDNNQCAGGFTCIQSGVGRRCAQLCDADAQCGTGSRCVLDLGFDAEPGVRACSNACDLLTQDGCPAGFGCMPVGDGDRDHTECILQSGAVAPGQGCTQSSDCQQGFVCAPGGPGPSCASPCDRSTPTVCFSDVCDPFTDPIVVDEVSIGFCT